MPNEPTGALIAVIGDNNNEFIFIGARREFVATQDGYLFLGVNENNLDHNTGAYDATVEVEAGNGPSGRQTPDSRGASQFITIAVLLDLARNSPVLLRK